ncbi:MAG: hypothetical protein WBP64_04815 [Nitrososphaeraceae archaeon]
MLTSEEIKQILLRRIAEKKKEVNPDLYDLRQVQKALTELETLQSLPAKRLGLKILKILKIRSIYRTGQRSFNNTSNH